MLVKDLKKLSADEKGVTAWGLGENVGESPEEAIRQGW